MTTRQKFESMLYNMGVFESDASKIMDLAIPMFKEMTPNYNVTWDRPASESPEAFYKVGYITVSRAALQYIDENKPNAWFRAIFETSI